MADAVQDLVVNAFKNASVKLNHGLILACQEGQSDALTHGLEALMKKAAKQLEALREDAVDLAKKHPGPPPVSLEPAKTRTIKSTIEGLRK